MLHQHRSSKRPVAFLAALLLGVVAAATAQYVEPTFYGEPTYYSPEPVPVYYASPEPVPVYYASPVPVPVYYSSPVPSFPYGEPTAPAPYYYVPPVAPAPYGEPVAPTPYYYIPPTAPTTPYGEPVAPTPYYYVPSAPTTPYGTPAPAVYYTTPVAPTTPYGTPVAPTYYYVAPSPVTPYAAPSTCPPCPTCETTSTSASPYASPATSKLTIAPATAPAPASSSTEGTCYCPYDADWAAWAISDASCRSTLYSKCKTDARLSCSWLDSYFDSNSTHRDGFSREFETNIEAYLYNDCPPSAPCTCAALDFSSKDSPASTFQCCKALKIYAKVPYSGLATKDVEAYCDSTSSKAAASRVAGWVKHALWHSDCSVSSSSVYSYKSAGDTTSSAVSSSSAAAAPKSRAAQADKRSTILAATFGALGGVGLAAAAAAGWVAYKKSNSRYSMV